jgi:molecular chaperone GrpE
MNPEEQKSDEIIENAETPVNEENETPAELPQEQENWPADEEGLEAKLKVEQDKYVRLYSEFDNFRRRTAKEKMELLQSAGKEVILAMLPVLDDFERALKAAESLDNPDKASLNGIELIYKKMLGIMEGMGLNAMDSTGTDFDAEIHEAITKVPAGDENKGKVVDVAEKGYLLNGKVIRFAKVIVGE